MKRLDFLLNVFCLVSLGCGLVHSTQSPQSTGGANSGTLIVLVRHAEKEEGADPPLSATGRERARALAAKLEGRSLDAIYVTPTRRTRQTAEPTAVARGLLIQEHEQNAAFAELLVQTHPGQTLLVVGHRNTVPAMLDAFEGRGDRDVLPDTYDLMFLVTVRRNGSVHVATEHFGQRSALRE